MKIEIDSKDYESLKNQLSDYQHKCDALEENLKELSEPELKKKAVALAERLFSEMTAAIFQKLGFDSSIRDSVRIESDLEHWLGKNWWNSERLNIEIGAIITDQYRNAFLNLGIITKPEIQDDHKL